MGHILGVQHVAISVDDLDAALRWYQDIFGFELVSRVQHEEILCDVATLKLEHIYLEIFRYQDALPLPDIRKLPHTDIREIGVKHFCFVTDDLNQLIETLKEKHVEVLTGPAVFESKPFAYICDNSGILIELMEAAE